MTDEKQDILENLKSGYAKFLAYHIIRYQSTDKTPKPRDEVLARFLIVAYNKKFLTEDEIVEIVRGY